MITTSFALVLCTNNFKTHYCPASLLGGLIADLESRGSSAKEVQEATKGCTDLPGICMTDRPWEDIMIGEDFKFSFPSQDFEIFLDRLESAPLRRFNDGREYFKLHGHYECLVLTPEQKDELCQTMSDMLPEVTERMIKADAEFSRRMSKLENMESHRDKNFPKKTKAPN